MRLVADDARDVPLARKVLGEHDVAGLEEPDAVAALDLPPAGERHDVLTARRGMPVDYVADRRAAEDDARRVLNLRRRDARARKARLDLLEMRLVVGAGVESHDLHSLARAP